MKPINRLLSILVASFIISSMIFSTYAQTITPISTTLSGFQTVILTQTLSFVVHSSGDILVISSSNVGAASCINHYPTITDSQANTWIKQVGASNLASTGAATSTASAWLTTATASGSITITITYSACGTAKQGAGTTSFDYVGYHIDGLQTASAGGGKSTTTYVPVFALGGTKGLVGAFAANFFQAPATTNSGVFITDYQDGGDLGDSLGFGGAFYNGVATGSSGYQMNQPNSGGNSAIFDGWSEVVLALPETPASSTTVTTTSTATTTQTSTTTSTVTSAIVLSTTITATSVIVSTNSVGSTVTSTSTYTTVSSYTSSTTYTTTSVYTIPPAPPAFGFSTLEVALLGVGIVAMLIITALLASRSTGRRGRR